MKKVTKFLMAALLAGMCSVGYAQTTYEWKKPPKSTEIEIGVITDRCDAGSMSTYYSYIPSTRQRLFDRYGPDGRRSITDEELYESLLNKAKKEYGDAHRTFILRNFKSNYKDNTYQYNECVDHTDRMYSYSATVVISDSRVEANEYLSAAIDKALRNVREGSRLAIDQVSVRTGINREEYKDQLIDILLDKGYKVVAKEYLEKLYDEIKGQESGIYNDGTTVKPDNFSAVGYYINVKVTETSLRVQVVNVSTGEYEGNATVNF